MCFGSGKKIAHAKKRSFQSHTKKMQGCITEGTDKIQAQRKTPDYVKECDKESTVQREAGVLLQLAEQAHIKYCFDPLQLSFEPLQR